jgi:hypothetical protein
MYRERRPAAQRPKTLGRPMSLRNKCLWVRRFAVVILLLAFACSSTNVPAYKVLWGYKMEHGRFGHVLVPSVSRYSTSVAEREQIARRIAAQERFVEVDFYTTKRAFEANIASGVADARPTKSDLVALKRGAWGRIDEDGRFVPAERYH